MTSSPKTSFVNFLFPTILVACCILFSSICYALEIKVKEISEINGDTVHLGDIATFHPANDSRVEKIRATEIIASPAPDTFRKINKDFILYKTTSLLNSEKDITLTVPDIISIERTAQVIGEETLTEIFRDYVMDNAPWDRNQIVIDNISSPQSLALPKGNLTWSIDVKQNNNFIGNFSMLVDFRVDGDSQRKIMLSGKISVFKDVVKALRNIKKGDIITSQDITLVSEKIKNNRNNYATSTKDLIGKRATRRIQADQPIRIGMFEVPPAIGKGDRVVIKAENNDLLITALGKALEEGCVGEQIRVLNISSGREIIATVRRTDLVEVQF